MAILKGSVRGDKPPNFIHNPKLKTESLKRAHIQRLKRDLRGAKRVIIYAGLSDVSKPYARKMEAHVIPSPHPLPRGGGEGQALRIPLPPNGRRG